MTMGALLRRKKSRLKGQLDGRTVNGIETRFRTLGLALKEE
jgi:hypothetical protein